MISQQGCSVASGECGVGFLVGFLTMLSCDWPWPAVLTVEKAILCLFSQTGRIMLITPLRTKALDLFTVLTSLSCPITHVTGALSFSLSEFAAFHTGRKTPMSFCAQGYEACSYGKTLHLMFCVRMKRKYILLMRKKIGRLNAMIRF